MQFELTKEYFDNLKEAVAEAKDSFLNEQLDELHPADIAEILERLKDDNGQYLYSLLTQRDEEKAADTLLELDDDIRERFLASLTSKEIAETVIENIESDDAADVISELPEGKQAEVISHLEEGQQTADIKDLLAYDEDTAGGLMAKELVKVKLDWTVATCIREMRRQSVNVDKVYTVYVVDDNDVLQGRLSLKKLLFHSESTRTRVIDLYDPKVRWVDVAEDDEAVAHVMEKYDLVVVPVVDENKKLLGRITVDDIVDVIKEEADKDYQMASGIAESVESDDKVWILSRARLPWLLIGLLGGVLGAQVIGHFDYQIQAFPILAAFIPLIAAMGGNVGVQSSAIIVQGLANQSLREERIFRKLMKEFLVGCLNGSVCSVIMFGVIMLINQDVLLGITVSFSLFAVIIFAALFGTFVPLVLNRYKIDPALATGPFITTVNDVLGLFIYFGIAYLIYIP